MIRDKWFFANCSVIVLNLGFAILTVPALAQTASSSDQGVETITVTAQRRSEQLVNVPITVNVITSQALQDSNIQSLSDITKVAPAIRFDYANMWIQPSIRGVGTDVVNSGIGSNVGIYIDGFYNPNPTTSDFDLLNISGIQVLKGPQGTLFGRNTTGGAILLTTGDPSLETSGTGEVSYGSYNTVRAEGYVTGGVTDNLALDLAGLIDNSDGYTTDVKTGSKSVAGYEDWMLRGGAKLFVSDSISALFRYEHIDDIDPIHEIGDYYEGPNGPAAPDGTLPSEIVTGPYKTADINPRDGIRLLTDKFTLTVPMSYDWGTLTSYTQARFDSATTIGEAVTTTLDEQPAVTTRDRTLTQEFLATSAPGTPFQWTAGVFGFQNVDHFRATVNFYLPPPLAPAFTQEVLNLGIGTNTYTSTLAAYFDGTYEFLPNWFFDAGVRYSHDEVNHAYYIAPVGAPAPGPNGILTFPTRQFPVNGLKDDQLTPRAVLRWKPDDSSSIYASFSQGYKAPVLNVGCGCSFAGIPAKAEKLTDYEVGYKYAGERFSGALSGFYYDYRDLQEAYYLFEEGVDINAKRSHIEGIEAQGTYQILPELSLDANASYVEGVFDSYANDVRYENPPPGTPPTGMYITQVFNGSGLNIPRNPKWTGNATLTYTRDISYGSMRFAATYTYTSKIFFDPANQYLQNGYSLLGLRVEWTDPSGHFTVAAYGDNVTNTAYQSTVGYTTAGGLSQWGAPATWGISFKAAY